MIRRAAHDPDRAVVDGLDRRADELAADHVPGERRLAEAEPEDVHQFVLGHALEVVLVRRRPGLGKTPVARRVERDHPAPRRIIGFHATEGSGLTASPDGVEPVLRAGRREPAGRGQPEFDPADRGRTDVHEQLVLPDRRVVEHRRGVRGRVVERRRPTVRTARGDRGEVIVQVRRDLVRRPFEGVSPGRVIEEPWMCHTSNRNGSDGGRQTR